MVDTSGRKIELFYCYAREDKALRDQLETYLKVLTRQYGLIHWSDREILPGEQWEQEIHAHLNKADIILLLISPHFVASDYCYGKEMQQALKRHREGTCRVIPILLRPTYWEDTPFNNIQMLPTDAKPITGCPDRDEAFHDVVKGINISIKALLDSHKTSKELIEEGSNHNKHERYKEAGIAYERAKNLAPTNPRVYNGLGYALNGIKLYEEALKELDRAIDLAPDYTYAYINKGKAHKGIKQYDKALAAFEQAIKCDSKNAAAYKGKGDALILIGCDQENDRDYKEALKALDKSIDLDPSNAAAYYSKGFVLHRLKRYKQALEALDYAIELDPNYVFVYEVKGCVLTALKRYEEALDAFEQAIRLDPDYATAHVRKGIIHAKVEHYEEALKAFEAIGLDANSAVRYYLKGLVLKELRCYPEALAAFEKTIQLAPDNARGYLGKGLVFNEIKNYEEAPAAFEQARRRISKGTNLDAIIISAIVYTLNGLKRYEKAKAVYEEARERGYKFDKTLFDEFLTWPPSTKNI